MIYLCISQKGMHSLVLTARAHMCWVCVRVRARAPECPRVVNEFIAPFVYTHRCGGEMRADAAEVRADRGLSFAHRSRMMRAHRDVM